LNLEMRHQYVLFIDCFIVCLFLFRGQKYTHYSFYANFLVENFVNCKKKSAFADKLLLQWREFGIKGRAYS
jgi:hypothetical protein